MLACATPSFFVTAYMYIIYCTVYCTVYTGPNMHKISILLHEEFTNITWTNKTFNFRVYLSYSKGKGKCHKIFDNFFAYLGPI